MTLRTLFEGLIGRMSAGRPPGYSLKHWRVDHRRGILKGVSRRQYLLQKLYFRLEPKVILPLTDILLRSAFFTQNTWGLRLLKAIAKANARLPHGIPVTYPVILRYVDFLERQYGPQGYRFTLGPCICQKTFRRWKEPVFKDIQLLYAGDAWMELPKGGFRWATLDEVKDVLRACHAAGLVHQLDFCNMSGDWSFCICNCEKEICALIRSQNLTGYGCLAGPEECVLDPARCRGVDKCGACLEVCHFNAIPLTQGKAGLMADRCLGCGVCATACPSGARTMAVRRDYRYDDIYPQQLLLGEERLRAIRDTCPEQASGSNGAGETDRIL